MKIDQRREERRKGRRKGRGKGKGGVGEFFQFMRVGGKFSNGKKPAIPCNSYWTLDPGPVRGDLDGKIDGIYI